MAACATVGLLLESCGLTSPDGCGERADCPPIDGSYGDEFALTSDDDGSSGSGAANDDGAYLRDAGNRAEHAEASDNGDAPTTSGAETDEASFEDAGADSSDARGALADAAETDGSKPDGRAGDAGLPETSAPDAIARDAAGDGAAPCNQQSCPNGCCNASLCVTHTSDTSCGTNGAACADCTRFGLHCVAVVCL